MEEKLTHKGSVVNFLGEGRADAKLVKQFSNDKQVRTHQTPPALLLLAADDKAVPPLTNALPYYTAMCKAGVPVAMHIYPSGGHGFGYRTTFAWHEQMLNELKAWLKNLKQPQAEAVKVACIGNSITDGYGMDMADVNAYPAQLQRMLGTGYKVRNFGRSGRTMLNKGNLPYMKEKTWAEAKAYNPDIAIVMLGTNDTKNINWDNYGSEFSADMQQMIDELKALPSNPTVMLCTPIQSYKTEVSKNWQIRDSVMTNEIIPIIKKLAKKNKLTLINLNPVVQMNKEEMMADGVHPTPKGAAKMAKTVAESIREVKR